MAQKYFEFACQFTNSAPRWRLEFLMDDLGFAQQIDCLVGRTFVSNFSAIIIDIQFHFSEFHEI
jgi:hypothetical protein